MAIFKSLEKEEWDADAYPRKSDLPFTSIPQNNAETADALPKPNEGQWWRVTLNTASNAKPIRIDLMEYMVPDRIILSRSIGYSLTIASTRMVVEAAELILARVADYAKVIGNYGKAELDA
jgi:hypothetical protein